MGPEILLQKYIVHSDMQEYVYEKSVVNRLTFRTVHDS